MRLLVVSMKKAPQVMVQLLAFPSCLEAAPSPTMFPSSRASPPLAQARARARVSRRACKRRVCARWTLLCFFTFFLSPSCSCVVYAFPFIDAGISLGLRFFSFAHDPSRPLRKLSPQLFILLCARRKTRVIYNKRLVCCLLTPDMIPIPVPTVTYLILYS